MYKSLRMLRTLCKWAATYCAPVSTCIHSLTGSGCRTAGSETTATCLSCITYYLVRNPEICRKLQEEVWSAFESYDEINAKSTSSLKYLNAVCLEGMRIYAPLPFALPRVVPQGGDSVDGYQLPANVSFRHVPSCEIQVTWMPDNCFDESCCS